MINIGRYRVYFTRCFWLQTHAPIIVKRFLFMTICIEARPTDVDREQQFPLGTVMEYEGQKYHYYRAGCNIKKGSMVAEYKVKNDRKEKE